MRQDVRYFFILPWSEAFMGSGNRGIKKVSSFLFPDRVSVFNYFQFLCLLPCTYVRENACSFVSFFIIFLFANRDSWPGIPLQYITPVYCGKYLPRETRRKNKLNFFSETITNKSMISIWCLFNTLLLTTTRKWFSMLFAIFLRRRLRWRRRNTINII